ncbi:MAG TPA: bifunctional phosphoserine phosphatase/homoserine phosphotransferase ThrH [Gammaproteobacteria bacterium]|nr:bifunctional phosphoserine phosphatase/homoserine phosphotransferase ThrH [Gammaproteobacteria bacterium]
MDIVCLDLEGVLVPEIWIGVAKQTGIEALQLTTRDIADYDQLMRHRLRLLHQHHLKLADIQQVIADLHPFDTTAHFLKQLRSHHQLIILSDTFYQFAGPLMEQLGMPTLFCHNLTVDQQGNITGYRLRQKDQKTAAVRALQNLQFKVVAAGDSYNDTGMLQQANAGILFRPTEALCHEFPQFPVCHDHKSLLQEIEAAAIHQNS